MSADRSSPSPYESRFPRKPMSAPTGDTDGAQRAEHLSGSMAVPDQAWMTGDGRLVWVSRAHASEVPDGWVPLYLPSEEVTDG